MSSFAYYSALANFISSDAPLPYFFPTLTLNLETAGAQTPSSSLEQERHSGTTELPDTLQRKPPSDLGTAGPNLFIYGRVIEKKNRSNN